MCLDTVANVRQSALQLVVTRKLNFVSALTDSRLMYAVQESQTEKLAPPIIRVKTVIVSLDFAENVPLLMHLQAVKVESSVNAHMGFKRCVVGISFQFVLLYNDLYILFTS